MSLILSDVLQAGFRKLGQLNTGKATGGTTTTIVDSTLANKSKDNIWTDGAAFIIRKGTGTGAAPENEMQRISAYANATGTFTVDTAFTASPASGDRYGYTSGQYPLQQMIDAVNDALSAMGDVDLVDTVTLSTTAVTTEYTNAVAWKRAAPYRIDMQGRLNATSTDNRWLERINFRVQPAAAGVTGKIIFDDYTLSGRALRVWYRDAHPQVNLYSDFIHESINPQVMVQAFVVEALDWQNQRTQGANPSTLAALNAAKQDLENLIVKLPRERMKHTPKLLIVGGDPLLAKTNDWFQWPGMP